jgi:hypothetical protein
MAIPFADILQDGNLPVRSVGVYMHFNDIVFYAPSEHTRTERVNSPYLSSKAYWCNSLKKTGCKGSHVAYYKYEILFSFFSSKISKLYFDLV